MVRTIAALAMVCGVLTPSWIQAQERPRVMTMAQVVIECSALADRSVRDCKVVEETPKGSGVGSSLLAQTTDPSYRLSDYYAQRVVNGTVRLVTTVPLIPLP